MKYSEKWGDSVDSAVKLALADLGLTEEQVNVTILEQPSKGFFGLGSKLAKVRVEEKAPEKVEEPKKEAKEIKEVKAEAKPEVSEKKNQSKPKPKKEHKEKKHEKHENDHANEDLSVLNERPADLVEAPEHPAHVFLTDISKEMGLDINIKTYTNEKLVYIDVDGPDSGTVIGKRGATLDALQYLTSLVVNKDDGAYKRVVINAEGYREKREKTLEKLANRLADKALKTGKAVRLEPMNPYERKVIHTTLQARPEVKTRSEGEEPYRKVVIEPARK